MTDETYAEIDRAAFTLSLMEKAKANQAQMDGTMKPVMDIVAAHDVVFALWKDPAAPDGVGSLIVKGANRLRDIALSGKTQQVRAPTAIWCTSAEQAEALRLHIGTDIMH